MTKKATILPGSSSSVLTGSHYDGDKIVLDEENCLVLYNLGRQVLKTAPITDI